MNKTLLLLVFLPITALQSQVFSPQNLPAPTNAPNAGNGAPAAPAAPAQPGGEMPFLDPGSETASWNGHVWNITNNRLFRGRFEKYLASPEDGSVMDQQYRDTMLRCIAALTPKSKSPPNLAEAVSLLRVLAEYPIDARHCDSIASAIYAVWMVKKNEVAMSAANKRLQAEIDNLAQRVEVGSKASELGKTKPIGKGEANEKGGQTSGVNMDEQVKQFTRVGIDVKKIMEREALRAANQAKAGLTELKAKVEFQSLIIQLFLQRRFEHTLIACRCYNELFSGEERELQIKQGSDVEKMFAKGLGVNPTISTLEIFANDAMRDVDEGVKAFEYLIDKRELQTASNRLMEAFAIGEYLPKVRTLPRTQKARVLTFVRDSNMLISSLEMKDYGRGEELLISIKTYSTDFDESKFRAAIESAKSASSLHINSAKQAAANQDAKKVEEEITKAATLWPTNPALGAFSKMVSEEGNAQSRILLDFESLLAQRNYKQIAKDAVKYGAVMLNKPEKAAKLNEVLEIVKRSETAAIKADELARSKNLHAAWESVREGLKELPEDADLSRKSAEFSAQVPDFAQALDKAWAFEEKRQYGISLAWFLKAKQIYPASRYAEQGISKMSNQILPESPGLTPTMPPQPVNTVPGLTEPTGTVK